MVFHWNPIELAFFVVSIIFTAIAIYGLRDARLDAAAVASSGRVDAAIRVAAEAGVDAGWVNVVVGMIMLVASASSLMLEPPPPGYAVVPQTAVTMLAWILVGVTLSLGSLIGRGARHRIAESTPGNVETGKAESRAIIAAHDGMPEPGSVTTTTTESADAARAVVDAARNVADVARGRADVARGKADAAAAVKTTTVDASAVLQTTTTGPVSDVHQADMEAGDVRRTAEGIVPPDDGAPSGQAQRTDAGQKRRASDA